MEAKPQRVEIYVDDDGDCPFTDWLLKIRDQRAKRKIRIRIDRIRLGNFGDAKSVGQGVIELRVDYGPGYRVYLGRDGDRLVILLAGGDKRKQDSDISAAKTYWQDYKDHKHAND